MENNLEEKGKGRGKEELTPTLEGKQTDFKNLVTMEDQLLKLLSDSEKEKRAVNFDSRKKPFLVFLKMCIMLSSLIDLVGTGRPRMWHHNISTLWFSLWGNYVGVKSVESEIENINRKELWNVQKKVRYEEYNEISKVYGVELRLQAKFVNSDYFRYLLARIKRTDGPFGTIFAKRNKLFSEEKVNYDLEEFIKFMENDENLNIQKLTLERAGFSAAFSSCFYILPQIDIEKRIEIIKETNQKHFEVKKMSLFLKFISNYLLSGKKEEKIGRKAEDHSKILEKYEISLRNYQNLLFLLSSESSEQKTKENKDNLEWEEEKNKLNPLHLWVHKGEFENFRSLVVSRSSEYRCSISERYYGRITLYGKDEGNWWEETRKANFEIEEWEHLIQKGEQIIRDFLDKFSSFEEISQSFEEFLRDEEWINEIEKKTLDSFFEEFYKNFNLRIEEGLPKKEHEEATKTIKDRKVERKLKEEILFKLLTIFREESEKNNLEKEKIYRKIVVLFLDLEENYMIIGKMPRFFGTIFFDLLETLQLTTNSEQIVERDFNKTVEGTFGPFASLVIQTEKTKKPEDEEKEKMIELENYLIRDTKKSGEDIYGKIWEEIFRKESFITNINHL